MRRRAFTLLEAVIALIILSSFVVACLQLRLNGLRAGRAIAEQQRIERVIDDVLQLASNQLLPDPIREEDGDGDVSRIIWRGELAGFEYECVSQRAAVSPIGAAAGGSAVPVMRYTVTIDDRTVVQYRPAPPSRS